MSHSGHPLLLLIEPTLSFVMISISLTNYRYDALSFCSELKSQSRNYNQSGSPS